ncbi:MAG: dipeptidase [Caldilineaceae bacterium]|nr:dipeptidase [Caldilineaceae bacterium]
MISTALEEYLTAARVRQLLELDELLRFPSISTDPAHAEDVAATAAWLADHMRAVGLENVRIIPTRRHPLVYGDWLHAGADQPTLLIYGHYDVQPVDPLDQWHSAPFAPEVREGKLYARGAADDKGQTFIHLKAVEALLATEGALPVNVKFILEGEEEIGSGSLLEFVPRETDLLAADAGLVSDSHILSPEQPSLLYGLRGMWAGEVTVTGPATDLHSGSYGGVIHNPNQALAELLAALHDEDGRITVPGFYADVRPLDEAERAALAQVPYGEAEILSESGAPALWGESEYIPVERTGARPTLEINGMWGGYTGDGFKTVIPSRAGAKISCRLVPDQDPEDIGRKLTDYLQALAPSTVTVDVRAIHTGQWFITTLDAPALQAAAAAYEQVFGRAPVYTREGGGIPVVALFQQALDIPMVLMGFGLPDDNLHAPNEKLDVGNFYRGIATSIVFMQELAAPAEGGDRS